MAAFRWTRSSGQTCPSLNWQVCSLAMPNVDLMRISQLCQCEVLNAALLELD